MAHKFVDAKDIEPRNGVFRQVRRELGVTAFGINQVDLPPNAEGFEHDESSSGQEEVYLFLSGSGVLHIEGETIEVFAGRYVFVRPDTTRKPVAGPEGLSWVVVGSVPEDRYVVREPF